MNIFDIITLIIIVVAIFNGWRKGFISQLCSLGGIIGGIALAIAFGGTVGALIGLEGTSAKVMGFIITFVVVGIVMMLLAKVVSRLFKAVGLEKVDTLLGIVLSTFKYALILSVLYVSFERLNNEFNLVEPRRYNESITFKPVSALSGTVLDWFDTFKKEVGQ